MKGLEVVGSDELPIMEDPVQDVHTCVTGSFFVILSDYSHSESLPKLRKL